MPDDKIEETQPLDKIYTARAMRIYGGGFVSRLGEAWLHADDQNRYLIETTFVGYWEKYTATAKACIKFLQ